MTAYSGLFSSSFKSHDLIRLHELLEKSSKFQNSPKREHPQTMLQAGAVGQEAGQSGLEEETEREMVIPHALVNDRIATGLADNQICPLHNDDGHEEGGVTRVLQSLPLPIGLKRKKLSGRN